MAGDDLLRLVMWLVTATVMNSAAVKVPAGWAKMMQAGCGCARERHWGFRLE